MTRRRDLSVTLTTPLAVPDIGTRVEVSKVSSSFLLPPALPCLSLCVYGAHKGAVPEGFWEGVKS